MSDSTYVQNLTADEVREAVRENYGQIAQRTVSVDCCGTATGCCSPAVQTQPVPADKVSPR